MGGPNAFHGSFPAVIAEAIFGQPGTMSRLLAPVLAPADLSDTSDLGWPLAELSALVTSGEVWSCAGAAACWATPNSPELRAASVRAALPSTSLSDRVIAERGTAAWIFGALPQAPTRMELAIDRHRRGRIPEAGARWRERVFASDEVVQVGPTLVTAPLRTLLDLAAVPDLVGSDLGPVLARLAVLAGQDLHRVRHQVSAAPRMPFRRRILETLDGLSAGAPAAA